ncbi:unnamed protein product [Effrenium voratum]|nr:unnamed protein product [Effrenium voratum]
MDKILVALKEHGFAYDAVLTPAVLGCHPQNRSSSMVNPYDCWHKGSKVLEAGIKASLLPPNSVAIEVGNGAKKAAQVEANKAMVASSQGLLAAWGGGERFLTCGCSHMVQWLRAVAAGIQSPQGATIVVQPGSPLHQLIDKGWEWTIIKAEVDDEYPNLPHWCQMSLNSVNSNSKPTTELEIMMNFMTLLKSGLHHEAAMHQLLQADPGCKGYIKDIVAFAAKYTGGKDFPLLLWLDLFAKKFGHSLMVGEEMMQQLTWFNFKALSPLPFCRLALLATILTSSKHSDGISRLVTKSDLDKMKGSLQENAIKMEDLLHEAWNKLQMDTSLSTDTKTLLFGRLAVRLTLTLLGKQKHSREAPFESFTQILQVFAQELASGGKTRAHDSASVATSQPQEVCEVQDLTQNDAAKNILHQHPHLVVGGKFVNKGHGDRVFILTNINESGGIFHWKPLIGPTEEVAAPTDTLKLWRPTKRDLPTLCRFDEACHLVAFQHPIVIMEHRRASATSLLMEAFMASKKASLDSLGFVVNPGLSLIATKKMAKGSISLVPVGTLSVLKKSASKLNPALIVTYEGVQFVIQQFKAFTGFGKPGGSTQDEQPGVLCHFFWLKNATDDKEVNMACSSAVHHGLSYCVYKNCVALHAGTFLAKEAVVIEPEAKKAKIDS